MKKLDFTKASALLLLCLVMLGLAYFIFQESLDPDEGINRGLDIAGGVYILLEAVEDEEGEDIDRDSVERSMEIIRQRVDELGVAEPLIQRQGDRRIRIELPGYQDESQAREVIGQTARLEFVDPDGEVILTGEHLDNARAERRSPRHGGLNEPVVTLELDSTGREKFAEATSRLVDQPIYIYLDDEPLYEEGEAPLVREPITGGNAEITGQESMEEASELAMMLRAGALPVNLEEQELRVTGPELGENMEQVGLWSASIGLLGVLLFIIVYYRAAGIISGVILCFYLSLVLGALSLLGASLTVPGIAGIILSIGMAVDANIIIFERIKEELRSNRSIRASIESGFQRALSTILDANVTTIIAAAILFYLADGPVQGFAVTLLIGLSLSIIFALLVTRFMMRLGYRSGLLRSGAALGVKS